VVSPVKQKAKETSGQKRLIKRPHHRSGKGQIFHRGKLICQWRVGSNAVGCNSHTDAVTDFLLCTLQQRHSQCISINRSPFHLGDVDPDLIHGSLRPLQSTLQLASQSVQPFFAGLMNVTNRQTDKPTHRSRYSICSNRPHLAIAAMWHKNTCR